MRREDILIVNDGTPFLQTIGLILEDKGHRVSVTASPGDALAELAKKYFHLVIVKVTGQATDSLPVLHRVRELNPEARLIILGEDARLPAAAFELEVDDYIFLPCRPAEVWRRIMGCLNASRPSSSPMDAQKKVNVINGRVLNKLSLMFHDLRGGLVSIQAALKLSRRLAQGRLDGDADRLLREAAGKAGQLQATVEGYLQPALRLRAGGPGQEICDIRDDVVDPVLDEFREDLEKHQVAVENYLDFLPAHQGTVKGDKKALKSVFRNLVSNAIRHGGEGCSLRIDYDQTEPYFQLQVFNSGPSRSGRGRRQAFSRPSSGAAGGNGDGLGLGLKLSRELLRSYGGDIRYEPRSSGTNVQVILPLS